MNSPEPEKFAIKQARCYLADMNPPRKSKPGKIRPVIVIQASDVIAAGTSGIVVVPLTTRTEDEHILRVRVDPSKGLGLKKPSDALLDQIHTIDRVLLIEDLGEIPPGIFAKIRDGVRFLLDFEVNF
jgi:mRNA interferase MazF